MGAVSGRGRVLVFQKRVGCLPDPSASAYEPGSEHTGTLPHSESSYCLITSGACRVHGVRRAGAVVA